jgi:YgiT-type zinc finger domain-containing protein
MICVYCKTGDPTPGRTTVTFDREGVTIVIRNAPARICPQCGEQYFDAATTDRLLAMAEEATRAGISVGIQDYAATAPQR